MRYLILILLCALSADAQMLRVKRRAASVSYPGFTADVSQTFESALTGAWSESDASSILTPQSTGDKYRGTYAMQIAAGATAEAYAIYTLPAAKSSFSIGFWYKSGTYASWVGDKLIVALYQDANGNAMVIREGRSAGDNSRGLITSLGSSRITLSDATWYWITAKFVQNATSSVSVYAVNGSQVGSTITGTPSNWNVTAIWFGTYSATSSTAIYFDEIYVDYTSSTFPLGPPSGT